MCNTNIVCVSTMPRDKHWQHVNHHHDLGVVCYLFICIFYFKERTSERANERKGERRSREKEKSQRARERVDFDKENRIPTLSVYLNPEP